MPSRIERYEKGHTVSKRIARNQELYQDLKNYSNYREVKQIEPVIETDCFTIQSLNQEKKRATASRKRIEKETMSSLLMMDENKVYDINEVLTEAKKERECPDELEHKRKLQKEEYNITASIDVNNLEELKKLRKKSGVLEEEQEDLKEIIDTIYSKKIREEIDEALDGKENNDLFSELLPTSTEETSINENLSKEIIEQEKQKQLSETSNKKVSTKIENSFFTKSMELSEEDMEEDDEFFIEPDKKIPTFLKVAIGIVIIGIVGFAIYWIYTSGL